MQESTLNREELYNQTKKEDERSDLKQHADKMLRDFEKFNNFSSNRAIWELVQNACDLSVNCEIIIDYRNDQLAFTHNGKPFETKSLISLIKQVSGKYGDQEDIPEVGKYGTGFLTTHTFSRKFTINSVLKTGEFYLPISEFEIDRSPKTWELLSDNIAEQKKQVYKIIESESPIDVVDIKTTFTYKPETDTEKEYGRVSSIGLNEYIPLVFTVNERLNKITVITSDGSENVFSRIEKQKIENDKDINLYKTRIATCTNEKWVYSLIDEDNAIEIILPIDKDHNLFEFSDKLARLFLYYPLVGSENFGINFLINCNKFLPNEPRSGIHLQSNKEQVKEQEESNRLIIESCTDIIFDFLEGNIIEVDNPLLYANVKFNINSEDSLLNEYFENLQIQWNDKLSSLPFVKTSLGFKEIKDVIFFDEELIVENEEHLKTIYQLASKYFDNIPVIDDVLKWSSYANNWNDESIEFIGHQDILNNISEEGLADFEKESLINYYNYLLSIDEASVFSELALLPNINGHFNKLGHLSEAKDLDHQLISFGQVLIPETLNSIVHEDFKFDFDFSCFNRRDFSNKLKIKLEEDDILDKIYFDESLAKENYHEDLLEEKEAVSEEFFNSLLSFCKLTSNVNSTSKPNQFVKIISNYYGIDNNLLLLPSIPEENDDIDKRVIRKTLVQMFFNLISIHTNTWVENNLELLENICSLEEDSYKELYKSSNIYPNQLFELRKIENVKRDNGVCQDIKDIFEKVKGKDINEVLSVVSFNEFIPEDQFINNKYLSTQIEERFFEDTITEIEDHPFRDIIISIIPKLTKKPYQELFPQLDLKKANIMISVVTKEETKDDIFAIVTLEAAKLKRIGKLINSPDFESILNQAMDVLENKKQTNANFQFKLKIGNHIETILRKYLNETFEPEEIIADVIEEQDGQDIIIKIRGEIKYYIEVKSRWDKKTSIRMSKNQTIRSNEQKKIYSLCSVDMTSYVGEDRYEVEEIEKISENLMFVNDIGNHVEHLIDVLKQTNIPDEIHLDGDYRTLVPQKIIDDYGIPLTEFETYIIQLLKK